ncbi:iron complex outermembrane receptor protein [Undibacterium sp. GrIS 1.2]|uniref:TonB-dependent receptor domain-containing protein n=1 Tax=Undibacterium sp. GrIS 1.2 TaxID=3143933 RepID=UPI003398938F
MLIGYGDLEKDGFNIFGVIDAHKQNSLTAVQRDFSATGIILNRGLYKTSGNTPSANFFDNGSGNGGNISFANGCDPVNHSFPKASNGTCRYDYTSQVDDIPETKQISFFGKGTFKLNADNNATVEYLHSESTNINSVAAAPLYDGESAALTGLVVPVGSKYYPGGSGGVAAFPGLTGDLSINWRPLEVGKRTEKDVSKSDRFLAGLEGTIGSWDYKTGFIYTQAQASSTLTHGYVTDTGVLNGVTSGILNPFGPQDAAGTAYLSSIQLVGQTLSGKTTSTGVDFKMSREFGALAGGAMGIAFGAEAHQDKANYDVNTAVASQASSTGLSDSKSIAGQRNIEAVFAEFIAPITKELELTLDGRVDNYSDVGSTFNPKVGLRYQPTKELLFRASANTGFRAPSLYEKNAPNVVSNTADTYDDPKLCPGGVAIPGANPNTACNAQQNIQSGGNKGLTPEKAKNFSVGVVFEPTPAVTLTADYWNIHLTDSIGTLPESVIFGDPVKYANLFVRNADGTLAYVSATNFNLGDTKTDGIDVSGTWRLPKSSLGNFMLAMEGTYVNRYSYQTEKNGVYTENVGTFADNGPVFRWKHTLSLQWNNGPWIATLSEKYLSGYHDQNAVDDQYVQDVKAYSVWAITGSYNGFKNLSLTAGVKNLFNTNPPFTNQGVTFQQGYDPHFTNPLGRALYVRATYKF